MLLDLPRLPLPDAGTRAPVRFLPTWDATLLDAGRSILLLSSTASASSTPRARSRSPPSWSTARFPERGVGSAPARRRRSWWSRSSGYRAVPFEVRDEAARLVTFVEPDATSYAVRLSRRSPGRLRRSWHRHPARPRPSARRRRRASRPPRPPAAGAPGCSPSGGARRWVLLRIDGDQVGRRRSRAPSSDCGSLAPRRRPSSRCRGRSVPTSLSPSTIGAKPTSSSFIIFAAYETGLSASMEHGFEVMTSWIFFPMVPPFVFLPGYPARSPEKRTEWGGDVRRPDPRARLVPCRRRTRTSRGVTGVQVLRTIACSPPCRRMGARCC